MRTGRGRGCESLELLHEDSTGSGKNLLLRAREGSDGDDGDDVPLPRLEEVVG